MIIKFFTNFFNCNLIINIISICCRWCWWCWCWRSIVNDNVPYSYVLNISYESVAKASLKCKSVCSAALFLEFCFEQQQLQLHQHQDILFEDNTTSSSITFSNSNTSSNSNANVLEDLLFSIAQNLHDPDAVFGVRQRPDLLSQAMILFQTGQWSDALTTYECLAQNPLQYHLRPSIDEGISNVLRALGYQYLLQHHRSTVNFNPLNMNNLFGDGDGDGNGDDKFDEYILQFQLIFQV